ncbi:hypothetical protein EYF80_015115 [Liparis tanakae]|uniref:Uncharacterized protein n=1 Tax=Liparis tanakae TaxID=230148 RepID=A0A4Z2I9C1_9TELE|nr:hypothetical protein EYF80_015115 [Liparis tanakae]
MPSTRGITMPNLPMAPCSRILKSPVFRGWMKIRGTSFSKQELRDQLVSRCPVHPGWRPTSTGQPKESRNSRKWGWTLDDDSTFLRIWSQRNKYIENTKPVVLKFQLEKKKKKKKKKNRMGLQVEAVPLGDGKAPNTCIILENTEADSLLSGLAARDSQLHDLQHLHQTILIQKRTKRGRILRRLLRSGKTYLLIQHVGVLGEPHTQKLEGGYNHGVEVSGLKGSRTATLVHDVPTYRADGTFTVGGVHSNFHLLDDTSLRGAAERLTVVTEQGLDRTLRFGAGGLRAPSACETNATVGSAVTLTPHGHVAAVYAAL